MNQSHLIICIVFCSLVSCKSSKEKENTSLTNADYQSEQSAQSEIYSAASDIINISSTTHYGMDISHFQGNIIQAMKTTDSLRFVICKATQGDNFIDPEFSTNWREIKKRGLIRGAYHFYNCSADPLTQANHFTSVASDIRTTDIAPVLDIEQGSMSPKVSGDQMEKDILTFLKTVEQKTGRKPIVYTDYAFAQEYLQNPVFAEYDLWLAEYENLKSPKIPNTWKQKGFKIWQKSASYNTDSRKVDLDVYFGELGNLLR